MKKQPIFSIIIPIYNCQNYINRLLNSILIQNLNKNDYEIIACDDNSKDHGIDIIKTYMDRMNIIVCNTKNRKIHCPGNTRKDALKYASGEWVTFIDNDDMFEPNAFNSVLDTINKYPNAKVICGQFREYNIEKNSYVDFGCCDTWLHGKWYKLNFLKEKNIDFKENLESHEDIYFNSLVIGHLIGINEDFIYLEKNVYKWVYNKQSLSRIVNENDKNYIDCHFNDYINANIEPLLICLSQYPNTYDFHLNQAIMTLLHAYFYYQSFLYAKNNSSNFCYIQNLCNQIQQIFNITKYDIIDYVYQRPLIYDKVKQGCITGTYSFIEMQSFADFIISL